MSEWSQQTVEEIKANISNVSEDELVALSQDERVTVQEAVATERAERARQAQEEAQAAVNEQGERVRYEDDPKNFPQEEGFEPAPLSAEEVPLEESRKDDTSILATD